MNTLPVLLELKCAHKIIVEIQILLPRVRWILKSCTSHKLLAMLLVYGPLKALRSKDKIPWSFCGGSEHLSMGKTKEVS